MDNEYYDGQVIRAMELLLQSRRCYHWRNDSETVKSLRSARITIDGVIKLLEKDDAGDS